MFKSKLSSWRFVISFWPMLAMFALAQWLMRMSGNVASVSIPWWLSLFDTALFATVFTAAAIWIYRPVQRAKRHLKKNSKRAASYLEQSITLLPRRALNAFLIAGMACAFYLLAVLSIGTLIHHVELTERMLLSLALNLIYGVGLLAPAVGLAMTLSYAARLRQRLSAKGYFLHAYPNDEKVVSWSKVTKRPWIIFFITSAIPVSTLAFFVYLILGADSEAERHFILLQAGMLCFSLLLAGTWLTFIIGQLIQRVMQSLTLALHRLHQGTLDEPTPILLDDEFGILARGMNHAFSGLKEREDLKRSLDVATDIHQAMLPSHAPNIPHYHLHAFQQSCYAVGGDYYDHIVLPSGDLWLVVADVAGKGYPAALSVANLRAMVHVLAHLQTPLEEAANYINHSLCETSTGGGFVTLFIAQLDTQKHILSWVNAGHLPVLCLDDGYIQPLAATAPPMGLQHGLSFPVMQHTLAKGEVIFAYSDGVSETRQGKGKELFGEQRIRQCLLAHAHLHLEAQALKLREALNDFGALAADDDVTMLFLQRIKTTKEHDHDTTPHTH